MQGAGRRGPRPRLRYGDSGEHGVADVPRRGSCRKVWGDTQKHSVNQITEFGLCPADNGESTASSEKNVDIYSFLGKVVLLTLRRMNLTSCEKKGLVTWVIIRIHEKDDTEGRMEWVKIKMKFFVQWEKKYLTLNLNSNSKEKEDDLEEEGVEVWTFREYLGEIY